VAAPAFLKALHGRPFLMYSPFEARYFHHLVDGLLERAGVAPDVVEHVTQIHSMLALVRAGLGVALVPESASMLRPRAWCTGRSAPRRRAP
jgi:DNA-binding transcriptional LysR family regulator